MKLVLQFLKFLLVIIDIAVFLIVSGIVRSFIRDPYRRTYVGSRFLSYICYFTTRFTFNMHVHVHGAELLEGHESVLLAGNHMSYLDVLGIASHVTTCFVTSVETKETPGLGLICRMAGCLFVERRSRGQLHKEIGELQDGLAHGLNVTIFPEATSTNGEKILKFRRALFVSATQASKPVVPMCFNYKKINGEPVTVQNRDKVCWYGSMPFVSHLWNVCGLRSIDADLTFLPAIATNPDMDTRELAAKAQAAVETVYQPVQPSNQH